MAVPQDPKNIVSKPPLMVQISDSNGMLNRSWAIWFRDLYKRTSDKSGNSIDGTIETVDDIITVVDQNVLDIGQNADDIAQNVLDIGQNASDLSDHEALDTAHGSNGNIVGFLDLADETTVGLVKRMVALSEAISSTVSVTTADVGAAPVAYDQTHSQALADLANANKAAINQLVSDFNATVTVLNSLISSSKTSGQMSV